MIPYQFTKAVEDRQNWDELPQRERPTNQIINLHTILRREFEKAEWETNAREILSRGAKDRLFAAFARESVADNPTLKYRGWAFSFRPAMNRYVALFRGSWMHPEVWYAPDKTSIVNEESNSPSGIYEIYEIPNRVKEEYRLYRKGKKDNGALATPTPTLP